MEQYHADIHVSELQVGSNSSGGNRWRALHIGFVKANFDGANFDMSRLSSVGVVIRDSDDAILASCVEKIDQAYKAKDTEGFDFRTQIGFPKCCS